MAFALFYDDSDLRTIAIQLARTDLPSNLKTTAATVWDHGFASWQVATGAPYVRLEGDAFTRVLVVSSSVHLTAFRNLLRDIAAAFPSDPNAQYMAAIADDISSGTLGDNSAAQEPWNG